MMVAAAETSGDVLTVKATDEVRSAHACVARAEVTSVSSLNSNFEPHLSLTTNDDRLLSRVSKT